MRVDQAVNIEDLHRMAKRRLPKIAFDFIEGGLEDERGLETNTSAFHKHQLLPRYLVDVSTRDQTKTIFGQNFSSPFGISPTGGAGLFRYLADTMLAQGCTGQLCLVEIERFDGGLPPVKAFDPPPGSF